MIPISALAAGGLKRAFRTVRDTPNAMSARLTEGVVCGALLAFSIETVLETVRAVFHALVQLGIDPVARNAGRQFKSLVGTAELRFHRVVAADVCATGSAVVEDKAVRALRASGCGFALGTPGYFDRASQSRIGR